MLDRKGLFSFLAITFGLTYAVEGALILSGFRVGAIPVLYGQLVLAGVMWVPALATVVTTRWVTREGLGVANVRLGPLRPYLTSAFAVPAVFAVVYALTWALGLGSPDWELRAFRELTTAGGATVAGPAPSGPLLAGLFAASLVVGPTINGVFGFGEELGWRGYLLPKLLGFGRWRAHLLVGLLWGLWHAPLVAVGFNYPGYPVPGLLAMIGLTTTMGIYVGEMALRHRSSLLAGWIHGAINGQAYGIWRLLFADVNPLLGGMTGVVAMAVWLALGLWVAGAPAAIEGRTAG